MSHRFQVLRAVLLGSAVAVPLAPAWAQPSPSPSSQSGTADAIRVLLDEAGYLRSTNQPQKADEALDRVLSLDPRNPDALALKAQAATEAGNPAVAQATVKTLQDVRPDDPRIDGILQAIRMGSLDRAALADARRYANAGKPDDAVAAYQRVFHGEPPPPGLAAEYYQALGATQGSWQTARDQLAAQLRANPQDLKGQIAFAELLTYRDATRQQGIDRLKRLAQNRAIADQANWDLRQAQALHPEPDDTPASPGPRSNADDRAPAPSRNVLVVATEPDNEPVTREYERYGQYAAAEGRPAPARVAVEPAGPPVAADPENPFAMAAGPGDSTSMPDNPFRSMTAPTPDEPSPNPAPVAGAAAAPAQQTAADPLTADIDRSIEQVSAQVAPQLDVSLGLRGRSGATGLGQLFDVEAPVEASFSPAGYGRLKVTVTPVGLIAGTPSGFGRQFSGTNPLAANQTARARAQVAGGAALDFGYAYGPVSADIGSTPLGFVETNVVGGVQYAPRLTSNLVLRLTAERRAVTDSLLSYGGQRDLRTGESFGGVTRNRAYAQLEAQIGPYNLYAGAGGSALLGNRVKSNVEAEAGAGFSVPVWKSATQEVRAGADLVYFSFDRNLSNFTVGQGGYFSPQSFFAALFPVSYRQQLTPDLTYTVGGSVGVQTFRQASEAVFPSDPALQAQLDSLAAAGAGIAARYSGSHVLGVAGGASGSVDYRVNDALHLGAKAGFDRSGTFTEGTGLVYARYVFANPNRGE